MVLFLFGLLIGLTFGFACVLVGDLIVAHTRKRSGIFWDIEEGEDK